MEFFWYGLNRLLTRRTGYGFLSVDSKPCAGITGNGVDQAQAGCGQRIYQHQPRLSRKADGKPGKGTCQQGADSEYAVQ